VRSDFPNSLYVDSFITFRNTIKVTWRMFDAVSAREATSYVAMPWRFVNQGPAHVCGTYFQTAYSVMIVSIKVAVSSYRSDLCNERHVWGWLIHTFCECVCLFAVTVQCGLRPSLVWVQFVTILWTGPVLRHLLTHDNTNRKKAGINWCLEWDSNPRSQCICGRRQLG